MARGLEALIKTGNVGAYWRLARLYEDGRGVKRDWKRMLELLEQGAEKGEPNATARLGLCYEYAIGVAYDPERALKYYEKASSLADDFELVGLARGRLVAKKIKESTRFVVLQEKRKKNQIERFESTFVTNDPQDADIILDLLNQIQDSCSAYAFYRLGLLISELGRPEVIAQVFSYDLLRRAIEIWHAEAKAGNLTAGVCLVELIDSGFVEELTEGDVDEILQEAINYDYAPGTTQVALKLEEQGLDELALSLYRNACKYDWPGALLRAGLLEQNWLRDEDASFLHLQRGAELNHAPSIYFLGEHYWNAEKRRNRRRAVDLFRRAAEMNLGVAQERYADYLNSEERMTIDGAPPNPKEAFQLYERASENGRELSRVSYAVMLYEGEGVRRNRKKADKLFQEILQYGEPQTKEALAMRFLENPGYEDKIELAIRTLEETAQDLSSSCVVLGLCYYSGKHVRRDNKRAAEYFGKATAEGEPVGAINFAHCCLVGNGVKRNLVVAEYFLRLAASLGDPVAAFQLAEVYARGEITPQNWRCAFEWYKTAVQGDNNDALVKLAECYWNGLGVERDYDAAIDLWKRASTLGIEQAAEDAERAELARMVLNIFKQGNDQDSKTAKRVVRSKQGSQRDE